MKTLETIIKDLEDDYESYCHDVGWEEFGRHEFRSILDDLKELHSAQQPTDATCRHCGKPAPKPVCNDCRYGVTETSV